mmetsp:Transcript_39238/g.87340  ORF Transcript_39238/g.87340 Transcript_39238/m.87340 type:complete len:211 (-) Transcript_39238:386-1018(-)
MMEPPLVLHPAVAVMQHPHCFQIAYVPCSLHLLLAAHQPPYPQQLDLFACLAAAVQHPLLCLTHPDPFSAAPPLLCPLPAHAALSPQVPAQEPPAAAVAAAALQAPAPVLVLAAPPAAAAALPLPAHALAPALPAPAAASHPVTASAAVAAARPSSPSAAAFVPCPPGPPSEAGSPAGPASSQPPTTSREVQSALWLEPAPSPAPAAVPG